MNNNGLTYNPLSLTFVELETFLVPTYVFMADTKLTQVCTEQLISLNINYAANTTLIKSKYISCS